MQNSGQYNQTFTNKEAFRNEVDQRKALVA